MEGERAVNGKREKTMLYRGRKREEGRSTDNLVRTRTLKTENEGEKERELLCLDWRKRGEKKPGKMGFIYASRHFGEEEPGRREAVFGFVYIREEGGGGEGVRKGKKTRNPSKQ